MTTWKEFLKRNRSVEKIILHEGGLSAWCARSHIGDLKKWCLENEIEYPGEAMPVTKEETPKKAPKNAVKKLEE